MNRGSAASINSPLTLLGICVLLHLLCVNVVSCRALIIDEGSYHIQDPWYDWPLEDTIEIIQRVKESKNHEMNSSRLFRSFDVFYHILPQNLDNFNILKKRYLEDIETNKYIQSSLLSPLNYEPTTYTQFRFTPPSLDFKEVALCVSVVKQIKMKNLLLEEVTLHGISSETPNFIAGSVANQVLQPGESITIDVLYFPRVMDHVEDYLTVQTSAGRYSFFVEGTGILNPYLLSPLIDKHIAADTSYAPSIEVFNPTSETLQIVGLFTTGGFLNLPYQGDTPIEFWQVNPYETRSIIRLNFLSPNPSSYRGTVNIATHDEFVITLPVEITVHQSEIICDPVEIDFGVHIHNKHTSTREISLLNAQTYPVLVTSIQIAKDDPQTTVNFAPLILPPGITTKVATVTHTSHTKGQFRGSLRIYTNDSNPHYAELQIPYYGTSIWGSIQYNPRDTSFLIKQFPTQETRIVPLVHHFPTPLVIYSAEVTSEAFRVVQCRSGDIMAYNTPWSGITVQFSGHTPKEPENMLAITTNLTTLYIPLVAYHGKLEYNVMEQIDSSKIDFGILALNEVAMRVVNVTNPNPVHIQINSIAISLPRLQVRLEGVYNAQGKRRDNSEFHGSHFTLESGHHALFILQIICTSEEMGMGFLTFQYNEKATLEIPVSYHSMKGTLNLLPGQLQFSPSFPGRILQKSISVKSTYSKPVYIQSVQSSDPRIIPITINATISPHVRMDIATVFFNPALGPPDENYMVSLSSQVLSPSPDDTYALQIDRRIINHRDNIWNRITADGSDSVQGTITINTDVTNGHTISFKAPLMRPSIITETAYDFDLTQIGSTSQMMVPVTNPSDQPLQVQLYSINPPSEFLLPPESDQPYFLPPRSSSSVGPIYFLPQYFHETNMSLYLKNNLTILEMLTIRGQGGSGLFVFADTNQTKQQRESNTPALLDALTFHLDASQMEQCLNETNPQLTITKNFIGMNKGNLPVQVYGLSINYGGCRDYGFRISPCIPFSLAPNEEILISVSFSPDFSSSVVKRSLIVSTSQGDISYPLEAEMPYDWLSVCADSQPLSPWQQAMRRCFIIASLFIFLLFLGYFLRENFFSSEAPSKVDSLTDVSIPVTAGATTHVHSMFPKITRNSTSDCSHLLMIKKLEMPNEDHFARAIDDFVASLPPKKQKKKKKKLPTITPTKPPSQSLSTLKNSNSNSNSPKVTKPQPSEKPQTPHSASGDTKKQTAETKLSNSSPHSIPTSTENQLPPKSKEIATSPPSTNENTTVPVIQEPQQLPQLPPEVPIPQVAEKFTHTPPLSPTPSVQNPVPKNSPHEQSKPKVNQPTKEIQIPNRKVDTGIVKHQQTSPARFSPNTERRDRIEKKDVKQHRKEGERVVSPVRGAVPKGRKSNRDKRKPKKEKVWEPKKILTRPQTLQQQADLMGLHSPPFVQEEKKLEQDLAAILSDEPTPPGSPTPSHRPRTASLEWPWEQTFHSNLGVAMLRSDGDSLVDDHELENTSAGVIGQITPPRMPIGGAIGEGRGNSMVPSPALDSIFARNIFNQSESLFGNSHSDPDSPPSEDEQNSFSAVYQLF